MSCGIKYSFYLLWNSIHVFHESLHLIHGGFFLPFTFHQLSIRCECTSLSVVFFIDTSTLLPMTAISCMQDYRKKEKRTAYGNEASSLSWEVLKSVKSNIHCYDSSPCRLILWEFGILLFSLLLQDFFLSHACTAALCFSKAWHQSE